MAVSFDGATPLFAAIIDAVHIIAWVAKYLFVSDEGCCIVGFRSVNGA